MSLLGCDQVTVPVSSVNNARHVNEVMHCSTILGDNPQHHCAQE